MKYLTQRLDKTIKSLTSLARSLHPMGYSLILILLLTMSCTDKKQTPEPIVLEPIIEEVIELGPIKLSYDKGLDLMLIDTVFTYWNTWYLEFFQKPDDNPAQGYWATYWDTNTHTFYGVTNIYEFISTNSNFMYTIDKSKQSEALFHPSMKEVFTNTGSSLLYIGSVSPLERVYLDPTNQVYYIKQLMPYDTTRYLVEDSNDTITMYACDFSTNKDGSLRTNYSPTSNGDGITYIITNLSPMFPAYDSNFSNIDKDYDEVTDTFIISTNTDTPYIYFTNQEGLEFQSIQPYYDVSFFLKYYQEPIVIGTNYERLHRFHTN